MEISVNGTLISFIYVAAMQRVVFPYIYLKPGDTLKIHGNYSTTVMTLASKKINVVPVGV